MKPCQTHHMVYDCRYVRKILYQFRDAWLTDDKLVLYGSPSGRTADSQPAGYLPDGSPLYRPQDAIDDRYDITYDYLPFQVDGLWGTCDRWTGEVLVPPKWGWWEHRMPVPGGRMLARYCLPGGVIPEHPEKLWLGEPDPQNDQYDGYWSCVDQDGGLAFAGGYQYLSPVRGGVMLAKSEGKWGIIDTFGNILCPPEWDDICFDYDCNYKGVDICLGFLARKGSRWAILDQQGRLLLDDLPGFPKRDPETYYRWFEENFLPDGPPDWCDCEDPRYQKWLLALYYGTCRYCGEEPPYLPLFCVPERFGLPPQVRPYGDPFQTWEELARRLIEANEEASAILLRHEHTIWGMREDEEPDPDDVVHLLPWELLDWKDPGTDMHRAKLTEDQWGCLDDDGQMVVPPIYEYISRAHPYVGVRTAKKDGFWGLLDPHGDPLTPFLWDKMWLDENFNWIGVKQTHHGPRYAMFNSDGERIRRIRMNRTLLAAFKGENNPSKENKNNIRLPSGIEFSMKENGCVNMFLCQRACGLKDEGQDPYNMQTNAAAFEGWAAAIRTYHGSKVTLEARIPSDCINGPYRGHYGRFLYRVLRFKQQYDWFSLSENGNLKEAVDAFETYLNTHDFVNNVPGNEAGDKKLESVVEGLFSEKGEDVPYLRDLLAEQGLDPSGDIHRQLPMGLFEQTEKHKKPAFSQRVFTGGASAVDLWTVCQENDRPALTLLELKAKNKMVGAISEAFFYVNYLRDLFAEPVPSFHPQEDSVDRGYQDLISFRNETGEKQVKAFLLLDKESCHPLITSKLLDALNVGPISYGCLTYGDHIIQKAQTILDAHGQ